MATSPTTSEAKPTPKPTAPAPDPKAAAAAKEAQAAGSIGGQVILDFNSDAGKGARGGAGTTVEENMAARDANLVALGYNPADVTGPPTGEPWVPPSQRTTPAPTHVTGNATKMSSLAAGLDKDSVPPPSGGTVTGAAARA